MNSLKSQFLLDPEVVYLNHGSFGATPRPVFAAYQRWQRRLEEQPVHFLTQELFAHLAGARQELGAYIHAAAQDVVFVPNATFALNVVARSLDLGPGDEVLTGDHEYGACTNVWRFLSRKRCFRYLTQPIPFPLVSPETVLDALWQAVTPYTRVIFLSHITSTTATRFPIEAVCRRAAEAGILTVIDGAHAPGQIPLDMESIGADFYFGNAHKWMCSPKGAAFLYARPGRQSLIEPLVVGWGWGEDRSLTFGSDFLDYLQWLGTNDLSAYLSVPDAIDFLRTHEWPAVQEVCHRLLESAVTRISTLTGLPPLYPDNSGYHQMAVVRLPDSVEPATLKARLYDLYRIEVPVYMWRDLRLMRISVQGYNEPRDIEALMTALATVLPPAREAGPMRRSTLTA